MKIIIMIVLGYLAYRMILQPMLEGPQQQTGKKSQDPDDYEYTDYEEVD